MGGPTGSPPPGRSRALRPRHNGLRHFEQSLAAVATAPLDTAAKLDLLANVDDYVFGHVMRAGEQQARAAGTDPGHAAAITEYIQGQISTGPVPHLDQLARDPAAQGIADPGTMHGRFERGLRALLEGAAAKRQTPAVGS